MTYETFRDMGIAYGVGLILIYLLVVAQFRSDLVPLGERRRFAQRVLWVPGCSRIAMPLLSLFSRIIMIVSIVLVVVP